MAYLISITIACGLMAASMFFVTWLANAFLDLTGGNEWWAMPAWMAAGVGVVLPLLFGSLGGSAYAGYLVYGALQ